MKKKRERQTIINGVSIGVNRYPDPTERKREEKERTLQHQAEASKGGVEKEKGKKKKERIQRRNTRLMTMPLLSTPGYMPQHSPLRGSRGQAPYRPRKRKLESPLR